MKFWKMHGAGNDFIVLDNRQGKQLDLSKLATQVCHRRFGVGADGLLAVQNSDTAEIRMIYYNSDGSEASMCGNGIRCFAKFVRDNEIIAKDRFTVETGDGIKLIEIRSSRGADSVVTVDMGRVQEISIQKITAGGLEFHLAFTHLGVPHGVLFLDQSPFLDLNKAVEDLAETYGPVIEKHPAFPQGTNVNFVSIKDGQHLHVTTWERGAGKTLACGTGACASAASYRALRNGGDRITVAMPGGTVIVSVDADEILTMEGGARRICTGDYEEEGNQV